MAWFLAWQFGRDITQYTPHLCRGLTHRETTDRETWKRHVADDARALLAQFWLKGTLHNSKKRLLRIVMFPGEQGALLPAVRALHRFLRIKRRTGIRRANIERQDNIGTQFGFNLH